MKLTIKQKIFNFIIVFIALVAFQLVLDALEVGEVAGFVITFVIACVLYGLLSYAQGKRATS